jgi:hypothetical protein
VRCIIFQLDFSYFKPAPRAPFGSAREVDASARIDAVSEEAGPEIRISRARSQNGKRLAGMAIYHLSSRIVAL